MTVANPSIDEGVVAESSFRRVSHWLAIIALTYLLLLSVGMIGAGFKWATAGDAKALFAFADNPFLGLLVGMVATALIQSSSTVTSVIVGLVAGGLPVSMAIPMIMGANIGTTITNTLVSLGHIRDKEEFKRAFSAATVHDFFNLFNVLIFLPLEMAFGILEKMGGYFANLMVGTDSMSVKSFNFIKPLTKPVIGEVKGALAFLPEPLGGVALAVLGVLVIFASILLLGRLLRKVMVGRAKHILHSAIGRGPVAGILSGTGVTVLVQSSSTTTSLMVPLAGSGVFKVRDIYPFTLGANIGTCITALLAATAVVSGNQLFALQIAFVHLFYNLLGVVFIYGLPFLRELPVYMSEKLADLATDHKAYAASYVLGVFFIVPGVFLFITR